MNVRKMRRHLGGFQAPRAVTFKKNPTLKMRHQLRRLVDSDVWAYEALVVDSICDAFRVVPYEIGLRNVRYSSQTGR